MVRKKIKVAPAAATVNKGDMNDLTRTVCSWLEDLDLVGHPSIPSVSPDLNIFGLLHAPGESTPESTAATTFAQARGLQSLRAAVVAGSGSADDLRLVFLVSLLLYLDPRTSHLRKAIKILLTATEKALKENHSGNGSSTEDVVDLVAARFTRRSWDVHVGMAASLAQTESAAERAASDAAALRTVASLQWLIDVPTGKRALLTGQSGTLFARLVAVLDALLAFQVPVVKKWHKQQPDEVGRRQDPEAGGAELPESLVSSGHDRGSGAEKQVGARKEDAAAQGLSTAIDCCSEILKATACLMSLTKEWDVDQLPEGDATLLRMCESCLLLLSVPTVHRECATHASTVLVHVAIASWTASGRWPSDACCARVVTAEGAAPQSGAAVAAAAAAAATATTKTTPTQAAGTAVEAPGSPISPGIKGATMRTSTPTSASNMIYMSFFAAARLQEGSFGADDDGVDAITALAGGFMPLPPSSALALCRALFHIVHPRVLLVGTTSGRATAGLAPSGNEGYDVPSGKLASPGVQGPCGARGGEPQRNLMFGPILRTVLTRCEADSGLSLRYFALQVLQAWCHKVEAFSTSGFPLEVGSSNCTRTGENTACVGDRDGSGDETGESAAELLSEVMDLTMSALVHPAKLVSSMAPVLLEHVFTLRHLMVESESRVGGASNVRRSEPERLVGRVLEQSAASKGKYVALAVLLPRIGAVRMLELSPFFVEQLVWAIGVRGNVSGQAVSLLLQFLKAMSTEQSVGGSTAAARASSKVKPSPGAAAAAAVTSPVARCTSSALTMCRSYWVKPAARALMQEDLWSRTRVAAYLLPEMFKVDPGSVSHLFTELRVLSREGEREREKSSVSVLKTASLEDGDWVEPDVRRMWAMIEVARYARKCGATGHLSIIAVHESAGLLQLEEVRWAALHVDETLRMSALSLLCTDVRVTTVPTRSETELLQEVLPYSLKVHGAQNRQALLRAMQTLLVRMRETARVCGKEPDGSISSAGEVRRRKKYARHTKGEAEHMRGGGEDGVSDPADSGGADGTRPAETSSETIERVEEFLRWLCQEVFKSLYPGCPFEREVLGLELVQLLLSELLQAENSDLSKQTKGTLVPVVSSSLFCRHWVDTLLALLGSSWDRSRSLSYSILARFPKPLAGYDGHAGATRLSAQGLRSSGSGRQRESDRGALILRLVFGSYARGLGLSVPLVATEVAVGRSEVDADAWEGVGSGGAGGLDDADMAAVKEEDASARFLEELCGVLSLRLDGMQRSFDEILQHREGELPHAASSTNAAASKTSSIPSLPHGVLLAAHHVLLDSKPPAKGARRAGGADSGGRARRGAKPRRGEGTNVEGIVQWERRRKAAGLLLEQAFRALRLSLLIVGEHCGDVNSGGDDAGSDDDVTANDASFVGKAGGKPRSSISVNANGHMGMVSLENRGSSLSTKPQAEITSFNAQDVSAAGARKHELAENAEEYLATATEVETDAMQRSAIEGQRAVVGAWLLAKEACRFLATVVAASPLPSAEGIGAGASAGDGDQAGVAGALQGARGIDGLTSAGTDSSTSAREEGATTASVERPGPLLAEADVSAIGETLLKTLLSLKHMGCVASAQAALQGVCEALLHSGRRNASLMCLPSIWLDQLLRQLRGEKQEFVLRRSAGLALAFMAILRAEPRSVEPVLLPRCMLHLLRMAMATATEKDDSAESGESISMCSLASTHTASAAEGVVDTASKNDWKGTVHAMNVLRVVFVDATLADDVGPYVTEATMAAVCGFEHPVWAVRNSSMMLFAAIMQRAVGGAKNAGPAANLSGAKRPHSGRGAVTADAFFQQHPKLHPFLLSQLQRATEYKAATEDDKRPNRDPQQRVTLARAEMHPVLYPILLLLARLKAEGENGIAEVNQTGVARASASRHDQVSPTAPFIPLVVSCAENPHFLARVASARALAALVPGTRVPDVMSTLLERLPRSADDKTAAAKGSNHIHGTLLQVLELLLAALACKSDGQHSGKGESSTPSAGTLKASAKDEEGASVGSLSRSTRSTDLSKQSATMLELLWLADPTLSRCPPIRHAMLRVMEVFGELTAEETAKSALSIAHEVNLSHETIWRIGSSSPSPSPSPSTNCRVIPGRSPLLSTAAGSVLRRHLLPFCTKTGTMCNGERSVSNRVAPGSRSSSDLAAYCRANPENTLHDVDPVVPQGVIWGIEPHVDTGVGNHEEDARQLEFLMALMCSTDVDVRDAVIKATKKFFGEKTVRKTAMSRAGSLLVWAGAAESLLAETHPPNVRRLARLLARVGFHLQDGALPAPVDKLWHHLGRLCDDEGGSRTVHAGALEVMGLMVRLGEAQERELAFDEDTSCVVSRRVDDYVRLVEFAVASTQPVVTRAAAVASLASSGLLKSLATAAGARPGPSGEHTQSTSIGVHREGTSVPFKASGRQRERLADWASTVCMRLWFVALALLQDDEQSVRASAARACTAAATAPSPPGTEATGMAGGGRVDLCAVDFALAHMATIAGKMGGGASTQLVVRLMQMLDDILTACGTRGTVDTKTSWEGAQVSGDGTKGLEKQRMDEGHDEGHDEDPEDGMIFGQEERRGLQEPTLFASVAAPYLRRALVALDSGDDRSAILPGVVVLKLTSLLRGLAASIQRFGGPSRTSWQPELYHGVVSSSAVGAAVLAFFDSRDCRGRTAKSCGNETQLLRLELARVCKMFGDLAATFGGSEAAHPGVSAGVALCSSR